MTYIPEEYINQIQREVNIVDLIGSYISLSKRGNNYMASCPFHEDNNPSFSVSESKQIYKCFSCQRGGNIFSFLQEIEGISFVESVYKAAEFANISLPESIQHQSSANQYQYLYDIHQKVTEFYTYYLNQTNNGQPALDYLFNRRIDSDIIDKFTIGYAPEKSEMLVTLLKNEGYNDNQLLESGVFYLNSNQQLVDRFRGRLIIPLKDERGRVIALSGRLIDSSIDNQAKYINSPETPLFVKNKFLFNMNHARSAARRDNQLIICEGYMDVIALDQHGYSNAVATMGTALTHSHIALIKRMSHNCILVFDGDQAGQDATNKAMTALQSESSLQTTAVIIPGKQDPDELLSKQGTGAFNQLLANSLPYYDFKKQYLKTKYQLTSDTQKAQYIEELIQSIANINSPIERQLRIQEIVSEFQVDESIVQELVSRSNTNKVKYNQDKSQSNSSQMETLLNPDSGSYSDLITSRKAFESEKQILFSLIYYEDAWKYIEKMNHFPVMYHEISNRALLKLDEHYYQGHIFPLTTVINEIDDPMLKQFIQNIMWEDELFDYSYELINDCFLVLEDTFTLLKIDELKQQLQQHTKDRNTEEINHTMQQIFQLTKQLKNK